MAVAALDDDDPRHDMVVAWITLVEDDLVTSPLVLAEIDYFAARLGGPTAQRLLWEDFESGAYGVRWWADALDETLRIARQWAQLQIGLADASLIALATRLRTDRIATLDQRHFRQVTTTNGEPFVVLPADAS